MINEKIPEGNTQELVNLVKCVHDGVLYLHLKIFVKEITKLTTQNMIDTKLFSFLCYTLVNNNVRDCKRESNK